MWIQCSKPDHLKDHAPGGSIVEGCFVVCGHMLRLVIAVLRELHGRKQPGRAARPRAAHFRGWDATALIH
jgi:hypothetical protein